MKLAFRLFVFILAFVLDVHVRASEGHFGHKKQMTDFLMEPSNCLNRAEECALKPNNRNSNVLNFGGAKINMSLDSELIRRKEDWVRIVKGHALVRAHTEFVLETRYGNIEFPKDGIALVEVQLDKVQVDVLRGAVKVNLLGKAFSMTLPSSFSFWYSGLQANGMPQTGRPRPLTLDRVIRLWGGIDNDIELMRDVLDKLSPTWKYAVLESGYRDLATIKELRAEQARKEQIEAERRRRVEKENGKLRKMFYDKTFLE